jgi:shikimate kinase
MHWILCGLSGCGKTRVGKQLASTLGVGFIDTDERIESSYGQRLSCREIYFKEGESFFRALEEKEILSLCPKAPTVIATGGGAFEREANRRYLKQLGRVIYLRSTLKIIEGAAYLHDVDFEQRIFFYEKSADLMIDVDHLDIEQITRVLWQAMDLAPSLESPPGESPTEKRSALSSTDALRG